jgi:hypothetical protein
METATEKPKKITLIIESENKSNSLWGRVEYNNDLIVDVGRSIDELRGKIQGHLCERYKLKLEEFDLEIFYDLTALFKEKNFLNLSAIAERAGINRSIMAQYAAGIKFPSIERAGKIQEVIHGIGNELLSVNLAVKMVPVHSNSEDEFFESEILVQVHEKRRQSLTKTNTANNR